jgi:anti-anti-sigma factor
MNRREREMAQGLALNDEQRGGIWFVRASGYLDANTAEELDSLVLQIFAAGCHRIVFDLGGIDFISSAGAGVVMVAHKQAETGGGGVAFVAPSENVLGVFQTLGLLEIFKVYRSEADAVDALR